MLHWGIVETLFGVAVSLIIVFRHGLFSPRLLDTAALYHNSLGALLLAARAQGRGFEGGFLLDSYIFVLLA